MPTILANVDLAGVPDAAAAPSPGAQALVDRGFEDLLGNTWSIQGETFRPVNAAREDGPLLRPAAEVRDALRIDAYVPVWNGGAKIIGRYVDATNYYVAFFKSDSIQITKGTAFVTYAVTYTADQLGAGPYLLRVEPTTPAGGGLSLYCAVLTGDGGTVLHEGTYTDPAGPSGGGRVGLDAYYSFANNISRFTVTDLADAPAATPLAPVTLSRSRPTRTQVVLTAPENTSGIAPLMHRWRRQFSTETPVDLGAAGTAQVDTPPDGRAYKYTLTTTDAAAASVTSGPITAGVRAQNVYLLYVGDSIIFGDDRVPPFGGLQDSPTARMLPILSGLGNLDWADASLPLADRVGYSVLQNLGKPLWNTSLYLGAYPNDAQGRSYLQVHLDDAEADRQAVDPDARKVVLCRLGNNDTGLTAATYKANLATLATQATGRGWTFVVSYPTPSIIEDRPVVLGGFSAAIDELVTEGVVLPGDRASNSVIARHYPEWYLTNPDGSTDLIHPGPPAWQAMAAGDVEALDRAVLDPVAAGTGGTGGTGGTTATSQEIAAAVVTAIAAHHPTFRDQTGLTKATLTVEDCWAAAWVQCAGPGDAVGRTYTKRQPDGTPFRTFTTDRSRSPRSRV